MLHNAKLSHQKLISFLQISLTLPQLNDEKADKSLKSSKNVGDNNLIHKQKRVIELVYNQANYFYLG